MKAISIMLVLLIGLETPIPYVSTDKPLYKPNEHIFIRTIIYDPYSSELVECSNYTSLKWDISDHSGKIIAQNQTTNCENSSYVVEESLEGYAGGIYSIHVAYGFDNKFTRIFRVRNYDQTHINIPYKTDKETYWPGDDGILSLDLSQVDTKIKRNLTYQIAFQLEGSERKLEVDSFDRAYIQFKVPNAYDDGLVVIKNKGEVIYAVDILISREDIQILQSPESGYIIYDVENTIYYYASNNEGYPIHLEGVIKETCGKIITNIGNFKTVIHGMGKYLLTPHKDCKYEFTTLVKDKVLSFISEFKSTNMILHTPFTVYNTKQPIVVEITSSLYTEKNFSLSILKNGNTLISKDILIHKGSNLVDFNLANHSNITGVIEINLFDYESNLNPRKLIFIEPNSIIDIKTSTDKAAYSPGDTVTLTIQTTNTLTNKPVDCFINLAAVDRASIDNVKKGKMPPTIPSMLLLEREVKAVQHEMLYSEEYIDYMFDKSVNKYADNIEFLLGIQQWRKELNCMRKDLSLAKNEDYEHFCNMPIFKFAAARGGDNIQPNMMMEKANVMTLDFESLPSSAEVEDDKIEDNDKLDAIKEILSEYYYPKTKNLHNYSHRRKANWNKNLASDFTDLIAFQTMRYTKKGEIQIQFDLNDAVTKYSIQLSAIGNKLLGATSIEIQSKSLYNAAFMLPKYFNINDTVIYRAEITNLDSIPLNVTASMIVMGYGDGDPITIAKGLQVSTGTTIINGTLKHSLPTDNLKILFSISDKKKGYNQTVIQTVNVLPRGFKIVNSSSGTVTINKLSDTVLKQVEFDPYNCIPGSLQITYRLYPSALSNILDAIEALIRTPCGCFEQTSSTVSPMVMALQYLKTVEQTSEVLRMTLDIKDKLKEGYKRLTSFETKTGGYEWFGESPGHETLTAYGLLEFYEMSKVIETVDLNMIERVNKWEESRKLGNGQFNLNKKALDSFGNSPQDISTAYIVWVLSEVGYFKLTQELDYIIKVAKGSNDSYLIALGAASCYNYNKTAEYKEFSKRLITLQSSQGSVEGASTSITCSQSTSLLLETTALSVISWMKDYEAYTIPIQSSINYILTQIKEGFFQTTQATVLCLKALVLYSIKQQGAAGNGTITIINKKKTLLTQHSELKNSVVTVSTYIDSPINASIKISNYTSSSNAKMPYSMDITYYTTSIPSQSSQIQFSISILPSKLNLGQIATIKVDMIKVAADHLGMIVGIIGVPSGIVIDEGQIERLKNVNEISAYEVKGNSIILYWDTLAATKTLNFKFIAKYAGEYDQPGSYAYIYYTPEEKAYSSLQTITIS